MDVIDYELKRFDAMQKDLESKRDSAEDESAKNGIKQKDQSKSVDDLDTLMDEERPKEVRRASFALNEHSCNNYLFRFLDGAAKTSWTHSRAETTTQIWKLVESIFEYDIVIVAQPNTEF